MYKSQFKKKYFYDWFCGPGSHYSNARINFVCLLSQQPYILDKPENKIALIFP